MYRLLTIVRLAPTQSILDSSIPSQASLCDKNRSGQAFHCLYHSDDLPSLPSFMRPLPSKLASEDIHYLQSKGALTLAPIGLQTALLQSYVEHVYPCLPLINLHDFLDAVDFQDRHHSQTSLLLYQAIMFSAAAFVDMKYLREAGFATRKDARKVFFQKTRVSRDIPVSKYTW